MNECLVPRARGRTCQPPDRSFAACIAFPCNELWVCEPSERQWAGSMRSTRAAVLGGTAHHNGCAGPVCRAQSRQLQHDGQGKGGQAQGGGRGGGARRSPGRRAAAGGPPARGVGEGGAGPDPARLPWPGAAHRRAAAITPALACTCFSVAADAMASESRSRILPGAATPPPHRWPATSLCLATATAASWGWARRSPSGCGPSPSAWMASR